jgi:hypothetical protein
MNVEALAKGGPRDAWKQPWMPNVQEVSMADTRDEQDKLWEVRSKSELLGDSAWCRACCVPDASEGHRQYAKLKGLGPVVVLLGVGLMSASIGLANLY